ncbi:MAG TPA: response regulator [Candidatus Dormibacteraeota bacterium]|nr:response regulator [Candidatus Dormibacteraeota bacterium]
MMITGRKDRFRRKFGLNVSLVVLLTCLFGAGAAVKARAVQPAPSTNSQPESVSDLMAGQMEVSAFAKNLTNQIQAAAQQGASFAERHGKNSSVWGAIGVGLFLAVGLMRYLPRWMKVSGQREDERMAAAGNLVETLVAEDRSVKDFAASFRVGPARHEDKPAPVSKPQSIPAAAKAAPETPAASATELYERAPRIIASLRSLLPQAGRATNLDNREKCVTALAEENLALKTLSGLPEFLPAWQLSSALEGLLKQLKDKPDNVTPSTLRTVAGAVDLLETLCKPGVRADLAADPPLKLLAVDDDPMSRFAVSFALKRALNQPDNAENAEKALPLLAQHAYDAIFLDVQMPGMDGFELCSHIKASELNRETPVVFVTCQSDFNARAKSTLLGAFDLIGKPFLTFEITVKALTLVFRGRLQKSPASAQEQKADAPAVSASEVRSEAAGKSKGSTGRAPASSAKKLGPAVPA